MGSRLAAKLVMAQDISPESHLCQRYPRKRLFKEKMKTLTCANIRAIAKEQPSVSLSYLEETLKQLHCRTYRYQKLSAPVKQNWEPPVMFIVHWDSKVNCICDNTKQVWERLPVSVGNNKFTGVLSYTYGCGWSSWAIITEPTYNLVRCGSTQTVPDRTVSVVFDTTASYTNHPSTAFTSTQITLCCVILWSACRHCIGWIQGCFLEIVRGGPNLVFWKTDLRSLTFFGLVLYLM